ncbi:MAG: ACT domain-containing protein, partial [Acidimicrobiales bacterium]|nr:ACT domain-containing protein [Acidimicrobiales bacterium]
PLGRYEHLTSRPISGGFVMAKIQIRNEVMFKAPTRVGLLADVTGALNDAGVNILAIGAYDKGDMGEFLMITSNNKLAYEALGPLGGEMDMHSVVVAEVPNVPGELAAIARVLADNGINVSQVFATSVDGADEVMLVLTASCEVDVVELLEGL